MKIRQRTTVLSWRGEIGSQGVHMVWVGVSNHGQAERLALWVQLQYLGRLSGCTGTHYRV